MDEVEKSFVEHRGWPRNAIDKFIDKAQLLLPAEATQESPRAEIVNLSAAGAGVQNMTVMLGLPETMGLEQPAVYP